VTAQRKPTLRIADMDRSGTVLSGKAGPSDTHHPLERANGCSQPEVVDVGVAG
jgi:hypothetical protein